MPPHRLTNFDIQKYYEHEPRFNGVYSRDNLPYRIKDVVYIANLDEYSDIGTHWIALYVNNNDVTYLDSLGVERIKQIFLEYKHMIQKCADIIVLDLLILW